MSAVIDELIDVLRQERQMLLMGHFEKLPRFSRLKSALLDHIMGGVRVPADQLRNLVAQAKANERLLSASQAGLRHAQAVLQPKSAHHDMATYSARGQKMKLGQAVSTIERRA